MLIKNRIQSLINLFNFCLFDLQTKENKYYRINQFSGVLIFYDTWILNIFWVSRYFAEQRYTFKGQKIWHQFLCASFFLSCCLVPSCGQVNHATIITRNTASLLSITFISHFFADRLGSCHMSCTTQPACQSLNYNLANKTCEFNNDTKYFRPKYFVEKPTFVYAENPDPGTFLLFTESHK